MFLAEQHEPVSRRVALKIIKLGMDTQQVIARFEQERQALALMDHPNIARVFDAGTTDTGRPYFVMELVTGEPITTWSDRHRLTVEERLELMTQVANAIQHAHLKGIIHRDIKPTNVLVSMHDGRPHAKIIDFGIAKAISQQLSAETIHTHLGQLVGTPLYMSPEQSEGSLDVDTRTDVYSLGVLLYELLTGTHAVRSRRLRERFADRAPVDDPRSSIRRGPSARFSSAVTKRGARGAALGRARQGGLEAARRARLDRHEGDGERARSPLRDRERARAGPAALPRRRAGDGGAAEHGLRPAQVRRSPSRRGDRGDAGRGGVDRRARRHAVAGPRRGRAARRRARGGRRAPPRSTTSWSRCWRRPTRRRRASAT